MNRQVATLIVPVDDELHLHLEDGQVVVNSRYIAERFSKNHKEVLRTIEKHIETLGGAQNCAGLFIESIYQHPQNKQRYKEYLLTRDGFSFAVMSFTGEESAKWKLKYIEAFNKMEQQFKQQHPMSFEEIMIAQLQEQQKIKQQLNKVNSNAVRAITKAEEVEYKLDNQMTINSKQQLGIQIAVKKKVGERLEACQQFDLSFDKSEHRTQFFSSLYGDLKRRFGTPTYKDILFVDYEATLTYVKAWIEPVEIR